MNRELNTWWRELWIPWSAYHNADDNDGADFFHEWMCDLEDHFKKS